MNAIWKCALGLAACLAIAGCGNDSGAGKDDEGSDPTPTPTAEVTPAPTPEPTPQAGLSSGTYSLAGTTLGDGCEMLGRTSFYDVPSVVVTNNESSVDLDFGDFYFTYDIDGLVLHDPSSGSETLDCNNAGECSGAVKDCVIDFDYDYSGSIDGGDAFSLVDTFTVNGSGTQCVEAVFETLGVMAAALPCTSTDTAHFAK